MVRIQSKQANENKTKYNGIDNTITHESPRLKIT